MGETNSTTGTNGTLGQPKVLLLGEIDHAEARKDWEALSEHAQLIEPKAKNREEFLKECESGGLDGVVAIYRTFASIAITGPFDDELIDKLPASLKFICHNGAGYDQVSIPPCTARKIHVSHVPSAVDDATADTAVFLILGCIRNFNPSMMSLRASAWRGNPTPALGRDPEGKVLGIVGMGGIGRNLARKMTVFGMRVIYYNRNKLPAKDEGGATYVGFEELLKTSDVVSLSLPLNPNTRHTLSTPQFKLMKRSAILVNTARGAVVDEAALVSALDEGLISGAGLDVFEEEPKVHPGLIKNSKCVLLPHMGTWTTETQCEMEKWNIRNVRSALLEGRLESRVGEQVNEPYD